MTTNILPAMQSRRALILVLLIMTAWPGAAAFAASDTPPRSQKAMRPRSDAQKPLQAVRPRQPTACSEFGAGFMRMPGSDSCVRVGGGIGVGVGGSR